ncbi:Histone H1.1 [Eumeta japonica]|uniref:Histone H1.1 n=1 Tax=Eumeta variegata TaxID=151549 RepID=A0A4C1WDU8_EUMVA|nr:Histone H1.1 [Eumeta japonica]
MTSESEIEAKAEVKLVKKLKTKKKKTNTAKEKDGKEKDSTDGKLTTKEMVNQALTELKNRKGTSLYAIKKYLEATYKVNSERLNPHIKRYIKISVENGTIIQTKGTGASGSFKLIMKEKTNAAKQRPVEVEMVPREKKGKREQKMEGPKIATSGLNRRPQKKEEEEVDKQTLKKKAKFAKILKTPSKMKSLAAKRRSLGTIIKAPKMKPLTPKRPKAGKKK